MNTPTSYNSAAQKHIIQSLIIPSEGAFVRPKQKSVLSVPTTPQTTQKQGGQEGALIAVVKAQETEILKNAEKVKVYDLIAGTENLFDVNQASKLIGSGRTKVLSYLRMHNVLMSGRHKMNMPYQQYLDTGKLEVKMISYENRATGEVEVKPFPLFTGKGLIWLLKFVAKKGRDGL